MKNFTHIARLALLALALTASAAQSQSAVPTAEVATAEIARADVLRPDVSHADAATARFFNGFFAAQSAQDVEGTMGYVSPNLLTYADATLGTQHPSFGALKRVFAEYMPQWGAGSVYPLRILGGPDSALVSFVTTPEVWGAELHILGAVDLKDGKIVHWVDYFDSTPYAAPKFARMKTPQAKFPASFGESALGNNASPLIRAVAARFQRALAAGDAASLSVLMSRDAVYEDRTLRSQVVGARSIAAHLARIAPTAPFGKGAKMRHIVGGDAGGGFEWIGGPGLANVIGITALELDARGQISRLTTIYDARQLGLKKARALALLSLQP